MHARPARDNVYTGNPVDRLGNRRRDEAYMAALLRDESAVVLPMRGSRQLFRGGAPALLGAAENPMLAAQPAVLLGLLDGTPVIALDLGEEDDDAPPLAPDVEFVDLRAAVGSLGAADAAMLAQARGFLLWRRTHRFCGRCGAPTTPIEGGYAVRCTGCDTTHFPRTDPAVIMLVTHRDGRGRERALLARNVRFGERRVFSTLAGFVEPGESLEETVAREVWEECGVRTRDIAYHSSQPWPFPASVMLGFRAETDDAAPRIDEVEIVEAGFFTRAEVRASEAHGFALPPPTSIARRLIDDWCDEGDI